MSTKLKLPKQKQADPIERLSAGIKSSTMTMLKHYQEAYTATYNEEISLSNLVDDILRGFMTEDKGFVRYHQSRINGADAVATPKQDDNEKSNSN